MQMKRHVAHIQLTVQCVRHCQSQLWTKTQSSHCSAEQLQQLSAACTSGSCDTTPLFYLFLDLRCDAHVSYFACIPYDHACRHARPCKRLSISAPVTSCMACRACTAATGFAAAPAASLPILAWATLCWRPPLTFLTMPHRLALVSVSSRRCSASCSLCHIGRKVSGKPPASASFLIMTDDDDLTHV